MKKILFFGILYLAVLSCNDKAKISSGAPKKMPPAKVSIFVAEPREIDNIIYTTGSIIPNEEVVLKPEISGRVVKVNFAEGKRVSKGQLLVKLNDRDLKAQKSKIEVQISLAKQDEARKKQLLDKKAISEEEYDRSESALQSLLAERELIDAGIEKTEIYAPFSGVVGLKYISEGATINTNTSIVNLIQSDPVKIEFSVPERYASIIANGTSIKFTANDGNSKTASVYAVEGKVDASSRTFKVRAKCSNSRGDLVPGTFVKIEITLEKIPNAIVVPASAIINEISGQKVYLLKNGFAKSINVTNGIRTDSEVQIISGVSVGDTVITSGLMQIKDNSQVIVKSLEKNQ